MNRRPRYIPPKRDDGYKYFVFAADALGSEVEVFDMVKETILLLFIDTNSVMASPCCFLRRLFL